MPVKQIRIATPSLQSQDNGFVQVPQAFSLQSRALSGSSCSCIWDLFRTSKKAMAEVTMVETVY